MFRSTSIHTRFCSRQFGHFEKATPASGEELQEFRSCRMGRLIPVHQFASELIHSNWRDLPAFRKLLNSCNS
jgi:hypothetical protein